MISNPKVFLIGMPGCGKSTLGKELAKILTRPFIDLDDEIEKFASASVKEIFEQRGEAEFRRLEQQQLHQSITEKDTFVMATGGGIPCFFDNMEVMKRSGLVVFLDVPVETIANRLGANDGANDRPLLASHSSSGLQEELSKKLLKRKSYYNQAHKIVSKEGIAIEDMLAFIDQ